MLYRRGFTTPNPQDGWVRAELVSNCRNSSEIASLLRRRLGGAPAPINRPSSVGVSWIEAGDAPAAADAVAAALVRMNNEQGREPGAILVETTSSRVRDELRDRNGLVPWEGQGPAAVVCENVHRAKGLEADAVIFVCLDPDVDDTLLYIGISRAVMELVVVGPAELAARLGLAAEPSTGWQGSA